MSLPEFRDVRARADWQAIDDAEAISATTAFSAIRPELWAALHHLGFPGGKVLVQGDGADALLDRPGSDVPGISAISATVGHPSQHLVQPSEHFRGGRDAYDATVAVMPMGDIELNTPSAIVQRTMVHTALIWATLRVTKPGGLAAIITNHLTMDANVARSRMELGILADLIGAVRLPSGALRPQMPGTDSVTDILLFTRRLKSAPSLTRDFIDVVHVPVDGGRVPINTYFDSHPEHMLGQIGAIHRPAGNPILTVTGRPGHVRHELHEALGHIAMTAKLDGIVNEPAEYVAGMGVLAIHNEVKAPHTVGGSTSNSSNRLPRRTPRLGGPGPDGPAMS